MAKAPLLYVDGWLDGYSDVIHNRPNRDMIVHSDSYDKGYVDGWNAGFYGLHIKVQSS